MADLNIHGEIQQAPSQADAVIEPKKTVVVERKEGEPELRDLKNMLQVTPTVQGNELVAIVKMLEAMNKNLAFLAQTIFKHLNPETKDGRSS